MSAGCRGLALSCIHRGLNPFRGLPTFEYGSHKVMHNRSQGSAADCDPASRYGADYSANMHRCYWDCLRPCLPEGSRLTVATPAPLPEANLYHRKWGGAGRETLTIGPQELGKQVFAVYLGAQSIASDPAPTQQRGSEIIYR